MFLDATKIIAIVITVNLKIAFVFCFFFRCACCTNPRRRSAAGVERANVLSHDGGMDGPCLLFASSSCNWKTSQFGVAFISEQLNHQTASNICRIIWIDSHHVMNLSVNKINCVPDYFVSFIKLIKLDLSGNLLLDILVSFLQGLSFLESR